VKTSTLTYFTACCSQAMSLLKLQSYYSKTVAEYLWCLSIETCTKWRFEVHYHTEPQSMVYSIMHVFSYWKRIHKIKHLHYENEPEIGPIICFFSYSLEGYYFLICLLVSQPPEPIRWHFYHYKHNRKSMLH
jgi:hypothetical protein